MSGVLQWIDLNSTALTKQKYLFIESHEHKTLSPNNIYVHNLYTVHRIRYLLIDIYYLNKHYRTLFISLL